MDRYLLVAGFLTVLTAVLGLLTAVGVHWVFVAISGVLAGLWWAFGKSIIPTERRR